MDFKTRYAEHTERGAALAMIADLDVALEAALSTTFLDDAKVKEEVFNEYGPLGNTNAKGKMAYLLKIIDQEVYEEICRVIRIRNRFAHKAEARDCDHPLVRGLIDNLKLVDKNLVPKETNRLLQFYQKESIERFEDLLKRLSVDVSKRNYRLTVTINLLIAAVKVSSALHLENNDGLGHP